MRDQLLANGIEQWNSADQFMTDPDACARYEKRRKALLRYCQGLSVAAAAAEAGVCRQELYRIIARALQIEPGGQPYGQKALQKNQQIKPLRRNSPAKLQLKNAVSGAFTALLKMYPRIREKLDDLILRKIDPGQKEPLAHVSFAILFKCFKSACQDEGLKAPGYPFNTRNEGQSSLRRYRKALLDAQRLGVQAQTEAVTSRLAGKSQAGHGAYERGELDGYSLDVDMEIEFNGREQGAVVRIPVKRIWLIAPIEKASTACSGYSLAFGDNYAASDVLAAIRNSVLPWRPLTSKSGIAYGPGDGFPSMHPELAYMCFDQLHMDNAMGQFAAMTLSTLERVYRSVPIFGPVSRPNFRPDVEGLFAILQQAGFGEWAAIKRIPYPVLCHAVDAMLAAYNNSRAPGSSSTRMEVLRDMVSAGTVMSRRIPLKERAALARFDVVDHAVVKEDGGTRVLHWKNARHYGAGLLRVPIDAAVVVEADSKDPREIRITCERSGKDLGLLRIERRWAQQPHDLRVRSWLGNDPALRHIGSHGADITLALYKFLGAKSGGAAAQRKRAVVAKGFMDAQLHDLMAPSAYKGSEDAPTPTPTPTQPQPQTQTQTQTQPHAQPAPPPAASGAGNAPLTPLPPQGASQLVPDASSSGAPRAKPPAGLTSTTSAFVANLLRNIESL